MAVRPTINTIKADIKNASIYLRSTKKFGKTTLFRDVILEKYGDASKGLLIGLGAEVGYKMLDNINKVQVKTYDDLKELVNWLISTKGVEHNIEIIAFDTVDELVLITDAETIKIHNKENPLKKVKSIKAALGGFTAGEKYSANNLIKPLFVSLQDAGFGVWAISHTKFKTIKEKGSTDIDGYMQLTSNLSADYESAFGDIFDIVLTGVTDKTTEDRQVGDKTKKFVSKTTRKLYFRETELIDAGGRFSWGTVPEYLEFNKPNMAADFIRIIEEGMEKSKTSVVSKPSKIVSLKPEPQEEEPEDEEFNVEDDESIDEVDDVEETVEDDEDVETSDFDRDLIKAEFKKSTREVKDQIKAILAAHGDGKVDGCDDEGLAEVCDILGI